MSSQIGLTGRSCSPVAYVTVYRTQTVCVSGRWFMSIASRPQWSEALFGYP